MKEGQIAKEIQQPDIERLDMEDSFSWVLLTRVREEWVRQVGPQLDIDVEKCVLGEVLANIINDDSNVFDWTFYGDFFASDLAFEAQRYLLERMDWEIKTPETPQNIREELKKVLEIVSPLNWGNLNEFNKAQVEWCRLKEWVEEEIKANPELQEAWEYSFDQAERLFPYWTEFLYGIKVES